MTEDKTYTDTILMIRPVAFRFNEETAANNYYQKVLDSLDPEQTQAAALAEFDTMVEGLRAHGVHVITIEDIAEQDTPDSIFPNNWVSFHGDGTVGLYPMFAVNRRRERRMDIIEMLRGDFNVSQVVDMVDAEEDERYLEGTGSIVLDRPNRIAYAAISIRTEEELFYDFCRQFEYTPCVFHAYQDHGDERALIYHTNVMMCIAEGFAIVCLDCIDDMEERHQVIEMLEESDKEIIEISEEQTSQFAGNMLQVQGANGPLLVMSSAAYHALDAAQISSIEAHCPIVHHPLDTIEACGGGSARCMMAEVFLPKK